jgi:hypothetical protein
MYSHTILGLRGIENLKARRELVIRCTKRVLLAVPDEFPLLGEVSIVALALIIGLVLGGLS